MQTQTIFGLGEEPEAVSAKRRWMTIGAVVIGGFALLGIAAGINRYKQWYWFGE